MTSETKPTCETPGCGKEAACFGAYEGEITESFACNSCCGHGNEDGHCRMVEDMEREASATKAAALEARVKVLESSLQKARDGYRNLQEWHLLPSEHYEAEALKYVAEFDAVLRGESNG